MEFTSRENIKKISIPLSIYNTIHIADAVSKDGKKFSVVVGLDEKLVEQLKQLSLNKSDVELQNNTSDYKRFGTMPYENWYQKNRTPFSLIHTKTKKIAALVWFGPEPLFSDEKNWHTAGWRSYKPFRGKGIMKDFAIFAMNTYFEKFPDIVLWIATSTENTGSINLATALGFQELSEASDNNTLIMVK